MEIKFNSIEELRDFAVNVLGLGQVQAVISKDSIKIEPKQEAPKAEPASVQQAVAPVEQPKQEAPAPVQQTTAPAEGPTLSKVEAPSKKVTVNDITNAAMKKMDSVPDLRPKMMALLQEFGVPGVPQLSEDQLAPFLERLEAIN